MNILRSCARPASRHRAPRLPASLALLLLLVGGAPALAESVEESEGAKAADAALPEEQAGQAGHEEQQEPASVRLARFAKEPASLAPIGVSDASTLPKWDWSLSYRYSIEHQDDLRNGDHRVSKDKALLPTKFEEAPRRRDIEAHRLGLAFAPHDRVTLAAALPVLVTRTHVTTRSQEKYATDTEGVGDLELRALVPFMRNGNQTLQLEMGLTAPTGSTGEHGRNGADASQRLSFPQQLGSGTVDLLPGIAYRGFSDSLAWGFVGRGIFRAYKNTKGYQPGDDYMLATWLANSWTHWLSSSLRLSWDRRQNVQGAPRTKQNPELDPKNQAGETIELGPGVNFKLPFERAPRFGVEMSWPVFQTMEGPQLERDWRLTAGWQWDF